MNNPLVSGISNSPMQMLARLKANPLGMLRQAGYNVPSDVSNPQTIIQHLMNSGQITQQQLTQAQQMAQMFKG